MRDLALALAGRGLDVHVAAGGQGILADAFTGSNVCYHPLKRLVHPVRPLKDIPALFEIRALLKELQPDLVSTHSGKAGLLGRLASRALKLKVVHTSHGWLFTTNLGTASERFYRLAEKCASQLSDRVVAVAESERLVSEKLRVVRPEKLVLIHNGIPDLKPPLTGEPLQEPPVLVTVARFAAPKDYDTLVKALGRLKDSPWSLQVVGDGSGRPSVEARCREMGLQERITFLGMRGGVENILAAGSIFLLSSRREGFPISILEAMRAGLPVIASDVGGVGEAVADGETGFLFPAGDIGALQEKLARLLQSPELRLRFGQAGRKRFLERFTLEQMADDYLNLYREVTGIQTGPL